MAVKKDMRQWLERNIVKRVVVPAHPEYWLLIPIYEDGLPVALSKAPIIAWDIQCMKDSSIYAEPITPETDEHLFYHAIRYPDGTVANLNVSGMNEDEWLQYIIEEHKKDREHKALKAAQAV